MPSHMWGDEDFDWKALDECVEIVQRICCKYGRFGCQAKEKFGCLRAYITWWDGDLHGLIYPGYVWNQFPDWLWKLDQWVIAPTMRRTGVCWLVDKYQRWIYNLAYQKALKLHPELKAEILADADHPEYITGGLEEHNKHWTQVD